VTGAPGRRVRVVTLIDRVGVGGAERFAVGLAKGLDPAAFESTVCTSRPSDPPDALGIPGAPVRHLPLRRRSTLDVRAWRPLVDLVRRGGVDVLHAHMHGSNTWAAALGALTRVPVVIATEHSWSYEGQPLRVAVDRHVVARLSSTFVAISAADRERMARVERIPEHRTRLMPLGLVPHAASPSPSGLRGELGLPAGALVVGTVASLSPPKAQHVLLEAFALLRRREPGAHLVVAGEGGERERLVDLARRLDLGPSVHLLGRRTDVPRVLRALDVFALSSEREGTPIAVMEAMQAGLPVVSTAVGGVPDLLGGGGVLVPPHDPAALGGALADLAGDPGRRADLGDRARERAAGSFGFARTVADWQDLYRELLATGAPGAGSGPAGRARSGTAPGA
jgi:glycosyltransferase involved in cell wall biosynthesis